jgi:hypothetical protein
MKNRYEHPFQAHYLSINNRKIHYLDEGQGPVIWMMHGMPMWSYKSMGSKSLLSHKLSYQTQLPNILNTLFWWITSKQCHQVSSYK